MDQQATLARLRADLAGLQRVIDGADPARPVPSCPGWTLADLADHVADVYADKTIALRTAARPERTGRADRSGSASGTAADRLRAAGAALLAELESRDAGERSWTWFGPDQTVGFWQRRMMQETVIHRWDAEDAVGAADRYEIDGAIADDGVDEYLVVFLADDWSDEPTTGSGDVDVIGARHGWRVRMLPDEVTASRFELDDAPASAPDATVRCSDDAALLLAIWGRGPWDGLRTAGDPAVLADFRGRLAAVSQ